jgi:mannose-6-phosphate isomerase-like protein (cupin superfamily)
MFLLSYEKNMHPDEYQTMMDHEDRISALDYKLRDDIVEKPWGYYKVLHKGDGYTVKELTILPGKSLSDQRHFKRDEHWLLVKGRLKIEIESPKPFEGGKLTISLQEKNYPENWNTAGTTLYEGINCLDIPKGYWHRPHNEGTENVVVVETWIGESSEDDIERRNV